MNSHDLTREQLDDLAEKARRLTAFLHGLNERMEHTRFPVEVSIPSRSQKLRG